MQIIIILSFVIMDTTSLEQAQYTPPASYAAKQLTNDWYMPTKTNLFFLGVVIIGFLHLCIMWPGGLNPDSKFQYAMAIAGVYSDHHPPLMSFIWRYLDHIVPGSGMMFLLQISLLYGSIFYLINSVKSYRGSLLFLLLPLIPQIFNYSNEIWKDAHFTFSFLFVASYLSHLTLNKLKPNWYTITILLIILLYGTAVKFQAQFCAPILLAWIAYICANYKIYSKKFIKIFGVLCLSFYFILNSTNYILVNNAQKDHSWQFVKIYDLAAISMAINQDLFPDFTKSEKFTMQELYKRFDSCKNLTNCQYSKYNVDNAVYGSNPILKKGVNKEERNKLYVTWFNAVINNPLIYLKHRCIAMIGILLGIPAEFKNINNFFINNALLYPITKISIYLIFSNLLFIILSLTYFILGTITLYKQKNLNLFAIPLICFNAISLIMVLIIFFCSMASTPRYIYISTCMVNASHIFAYLCFNKERKKI